MFGKKKKKPVPDGVNPEKMKEKIEEGLRKICCFKNDIARNQYVPPELKQSFIKLLDRIFDEFDRIIRDYHRDNKG